MPPEAVPSNASVASTGKGLRYIGSHCYAYSGLITIPAVGEATTEMIAFTSGGSGYIAGELAWHSEASTSTDEFVIIKFNSVKIMQSRYSNAYYSSNDQPFGMIIPPFTDVVMLFGCDGGTDGTMTFTGRVYGAE